MNLLTNPTRILFFTGKGGVGKTSLACATAVSLADQGKKVLLVSTDPASNLDEVLGAALGNHPTPVPAVANLSGMNLDPQAAAAEYRERMVGPYRSLLPAAAIASMEEQYSGSCTLEIAAFDEFSRLLGNLSATADFDHVIFDTAPTGHTLRLLTLPTAWSTFLTTNDTGTSCLGPLAGLQAQQELYHQTVLSLADPSLTTLILVARPETTALREAARTSRELAALGILNQHLIINGYFTTVYQNDPVATAMQARMTHALDDLPAELVALPRTTIRLSASNVLGLASLRAIFGSDASIADDQTPAIHHVDLPPGLGSLMDELAEPGHGVILTMGKGGVGKTTVAAAVAVGLAERGHRVHLSTTDPAAHLAAAVMGNSMPNLQVSRIDPQQVTSAYTTEVMGVAGANLDAAGKALLAEDLRSPCTEEIAVFRAFAQVVAEGQKQFVVLDTAPTGHTILLLDAALAYHKEVARQASEMPEFVVQLLPRLRNSNLTRILIVTLPEATPVHEAGQLQQDLRRAEIEPYAWVINQSLAPLSVHDPVLHARQNHERPYIDEVVNKHAARTALIEWQNEPPTGILALEKLLTSTNRS
ncbi:arsenical pump-driving ATPase [Schlesneria paludicola]|uniref:arsenical pump-driving ATPase n=1 Tax=Schlesneria paludicola TaxID=360056 RepID=UPI00049239C6|nr:arsenical pump-driving ATPase [Schlesneria paludicola]